MVTAIRSTTMKKALEHTSFPELAERINALYNEEEDALLLAMLRTTHVADPTT